MPRLNNAGAARLEAANAALLSSVSAADWSQVVLLALRALLGGGGAGLVLGRGDELQFHGDEKAVTLLRHTHSRGSTRAGPIFPRGFWLHSGPHHAGSDPRPHDAIGLCDVIDDDGSFVGACGTFARPLPPTASRSRLRLLKAIRPALTASARQQLLRLSESSELAAMLEVVGDAAALVTPSGEIVKVSSQLRSLLDAEAPEQAIRAAISTLAKGASCLKTGPKASLDARCCSELESAAGSFMLRCCPMPGDATTGRRLILVALYARRVADLPTPTELAKQFGLTRRECDVAFQLHTGKSNAEIAEALGISAFTARHHTEHVLMKLGVRTRSAVHAALRQLALAVAGGAQLPVRALGGRAHAARDRSRATAAASHKHGAGRRGRIKVVDTPTAAPGALARRTRRLADEPARWRYDAAVGDSAAPIAPRAD